MALAGRWSPWPAKMLHFDIDWDELNRVSDELGATTKQVRYAISRALRRTEATLRKQSSKAMTKQLQLRTATALRNRLRSIRLKGNAKNQEMGLWYGLNPLPVSAFKGPAKQDDKGAWKRDYYFEDAFVATGSKTGKRTIFKRSKEARLPITEQSIAIEDQAIVLIEDEIFVTVVEVFWRNFERDLRARVKYSLGER